MLPVILASPAFPSLSILSHTYPYLSGSFLSPLVVPRFVRNPKVFLTSPYFARLTLLSRIFPDHPSLLRVGPGFSRMPRLFQFPQPLLCCNHAHFCSIQHVRPQLPCLTDGVYSSIRILLLLVDIELGVGCRCLRTVSSTRILSVLSK